MEDRITNFIDLETSARQFQDAIISAYNDNCPSIARRYSRNISWWNQDLAERRRNFADYSMLRRSQGIGLTTKTF
jgi:hypothetical protein